MRDLGDPEENVSIKARKSLKRRTRIGISGLVVLLLAGMVSGGALSFSGAASATPPAARTPIQHVVVIFQENESFDHYFGTYPVASNPAGENTLYRPSRHAISQRLGR